MQERKYVIFKDKRDEFLTTKI